MATVLAKRRSNSPAKLGMTVVRAPGYSPHAVAEHTLGLMLAAERDCGELRIYVTNTKTETKVELMAT